MAGGGGFCFFGNIRGQIPFLITMQSNPMLRPLPHPPAGAGISLQLLVKQLVDNSRQEADRNRTLIVNDVVSRFMLGTGEEPVIPVLEELLRAVVENSRDGQIYISADCYGDVVTLEIEDRNNYNGYALTSRISSIEPEAAGVGGQISIRDPGKRVATICFSFPNERGAYLPE